jgi:hypothetical protein
MRQAAFTAQGAIVPQRDPDLAPRKVGFFEHLGFGRSRR